MTSTLRQVLRRAMTPTPRPTDNRRPTSIDCALAWHALFIDLAYHSWLPIYWACQQRKLSRVTNDCSRQTNDTMFRFNDFCAYSCTNTKLVKLCSAILYGLHLQLVSFACVLCKETYVQFNSWFIFQRRRRCYRYMSY